MMKYIMVSGQGPIIFSGALSHQNVAFMMNIDNSRITSAGFFKITPSGAYCYGASTTLGKKANPGDSDQINKLAGDNFY